MKGGTTVALGLVGLVLLGAAAPDPRAPCAERDLLRRPFFGDTHVHTGLSQDASTQDVRSTPRDAYRFARGEPLGLPPHDAAGRPLRTLRLERPLDFAIVTDHAEQLGEVRICQTPGLVGYDSWVCRLFRGFPRVAFFVMNTKATYFSRPSRFAFCGKDGALCREAARGPWQEIRDAAEGAYDRSPACSFTTFVGYEWTASTGARNLHRNVIFRGSVVPPSPTTYFEANRPEDLWAALRRECIDAGDGCDVLTIPHNPNLSGGLMFETVRADGTPIGREHALERSFFEPLVEVMQHKGDSECALGAGTQDELCDFEKLPYDTFQGKYVPLLARPAPASSFVRDALKQGLLVEQATGANPFRYGLIASTDTHLGAAGATEERAHPGHGGAGAPGATPDRKGLPDDLEFGPGGLAVLWAEENTRDALFDAMRRREAYGTSGTRPIVRFFGGPDLPSDLCDRRDFVATGYAKGVPMGGVLPSAPGDERPPRFAVWALADPGTTAHPGTPLQRVQIVKGWVEGGEARERVFEVAGDPDDGADVDLATCTPRGRGAASLCRVFTDPDFVPGQRAFWYARVVENPSCRWSAYLCVKAGVDCGDPSHVPEGFEPCCAKEHHWTIQERAWTSPIWSASAAPGSTPSAPGSAP
ncbi:MAG TPA: DUF3604 domain-containing protein [Myxococcota bacterium]|nr:DUF3604 domain-containing protein [Myxococcota bacterium]